jgi:hypothetical protein
MASEDRIQSFDGFYQSIRSARYEEFRMGPESNVESADAFEQMREHLLNLYQGVEVTHSFIEHGGHVIDCIPIEQDPSVRLTGGKILEPPPPVQVRQSYNEAPPKFVSHPIVSPVPNQLHPDYQDRFGNQMSCPAGTIPMNRVTLEQLTRFRNVHDFLRKEPLMSVNPGAQAENATAFSSSSRRHTVGFETVDNLGGSSMVNVWKPFVSALQQSYSQQWYTATQDITFQSVECGWHIDSQRYGDSDPHLFVYWTPDTYTTGGFNTDGGYFVPNPGSNYLPGISLAFSQTAGSQVEYSMGFFLTGGAWWFSFNGQWVGYYPLSLFQGGPLASHADTVEFGGETDTSFGFWPPMGSGALAASGFGTAAYQRATIVTPVGDAARPANLTQSPSATTCYTLDVTNLSGSDWGTYIFYGGPGGTSC